MRKNNFPIFFSATRVSTFSTGRAENWLKFIKLSTGIFIGIRGLFINFIGVVRTSDKNSENRFEWTAWSNFQIKFFMEIEWPKFRKKNDFTDLRRTLDAEFESVFRILIASLNRSARSNYETSVYIAMVLDNEIKHRYVQSPWRHFPCTKPMSRFFFFLFILLHVHSYYTHYCWHCLKSWWWLLSFFMFRLNNHRIYTEQVAYTVTTK